ncbi:MAG: phosphatase PAP2 family protein [Bacteriovoracaceae bacterium]|jgi:undecaprenyl-diphosphatase|nr:phosphatase PAP2 family protein [Halobacteriovoraceae bacterium]MDP7319290.1 phosphatase PAP2 family protein [Bacteriovoracaceae bacterium]|tara:strand:+ start:866 stop:1456 length:591 start_codon:yes stop_codon:yes gene_type:complete
MLETLNAIDTSIFLFLNQLHSPLLDPIMLALSYNTWLMSIIILSIFSFGFIHYKKHFFTVFFFAIVAFGLSDSISSRIFKPGFERLRPCHNPALEDKVYLAGQNCGGGKYGFFSSHASNSFALVMFFWLFFRKFRKYFSVLFIYAALVSYSRIYLARHYPGDIIAGALFGILCALFSFYCYQKLIAKRTKNLSSPS